MLPMLMVQKGLTTDDKFLNSGTTKYVEHLYYTGGAQNDHGIYEAFTRRV